MAPITNFLALYRHLGLAPGCDLEALRLAYRRRMAARHPDRHPGQRPGDLAELQQLTRMYAAAVDFHRRHGHLPGAPAGASSRMRPPASGSRPGIATERSRLRPGRLVLVAATVGLLLAWHAWRSPPSIPAPPPDEAVDAPPKKAAADDNAAAPAFIEPGATRDDVRKAQGAPQVEEVDRWDYGPSWVRFQDDHVVDWYSSPLRPLRVRPDAMRSAP